MMIGDILALTDGEEPVSSSGDVALEIARTFSAHLTIVGTPRDPGQIFYLAQAPAKVLVEAVRHFNHNADNAAMVIAERAGANSIKCQRRTIEALPSELPAIIGRIARRFDLCVLPLPSVESNHADQKLFEAVLFHSGRPVICAPRDCVPRLTFDRISIAWDGGRQAARAVADSLPFLRRAHWVEIVSVSGSRETAEDEFPAWTIANHLACHGVTCEIKQLAGKGTIASQIFARVAETQSDLIVMGGYRHSRLREALIGGTTRDLLESARIPILMSR